MRSAQAAGVTARRTELLANLAVSRRSSSVSGAEGVGAERVQPRPPLPPERTLRPHAGARDGASRGSRWSNPANLSLPGIPRHFVVGVDPHTLPRSGSRVRASSPAVSLSHTPKSGRPRVSNFPRAVQPGGTRGCGMAGGRVTIGSRPGGVRRLRPPAPTAGVHAVAPPAQGSPSRSPGELPCVWPALRVAGADRVGPFRFRVVARSVARRG
jgi:hypothetical protein